jgi:hypothetical protein
VSLRFCKKETNVANVCFDQGYNMFQCAPQRTAQETRMLKTKQIKVKNKEEMIGLSRGVSFNLQKYDTIQNACEDVNTATTLDILNGSRHVSRYNYVPPCRLLVSYSDDDSYIARALPIRLNVSLLIVLFSIAIKMTTPAYFFLSLIYILETLTHTKSSSITFDNINKYNLRKFFNCYVKYSHQI